MTMCLTCRISNKLTVDLKPPTAGARLLVLDGGGIRGIFTILAIQALEAVRKLPYPIYDDFDLAIGTSSGTSVGAEAYTTNRLHRRAYHSYDVSSTNYVKMPFAFRSPCKQGIFQTPKRVMLLDIWGHIILRYGQPLWLYANRELYKRSLRREYPILQWPWP